MEYLTLALVILVAPGVILFLNFVSPSLWVTAFSSDVSIKVTTLVGVRLGRVRPRRIVNPMIKATKAGLDLWIKNLEVHYLAEGNVNTPVDASIVAQKANINLKFEQAAAIDLAGRDVLEAVQISVNSKVIEAPNISAVAQDGIEVVVKAKVIIWANVNRLVGGAGEETIITRVGGGVVTTVGSAASYKAVLENPDSISEVVLEKGLDSGIACETLSIDIADVDVARNIGTRLQTDQVEADKKVAEAKTSERRAVAMAREQEMQTKVVEAESQVPLTLAEALKEGHLGVMDCYEMQNVLSDTSMREAISKATDSKEKMVKKGSFRGKGKNWWGFS